VADYTARFDAAGNTLLIANRRTGEVDTLREVEFLQVGGRYFGLTSALSSVAASGPVDLDLVLVEITAQNLASAHGANLL
jgi:hypothetical protein